MRPEKRVAAETGNVESVHPARKETGNEILRQRRKSGKHPLESGW